MAWLNLPACIVPSISNTRLFPPLTHVWGMWENQMRDERQTSLAANVISWIESYYTSLSPSLSPSFSRSLSLSLPLSLREKDLTSVLLDSKGVLQRSGFAGGRMLKATNDLMFSVVYHRNIFIMNAQSLVRPLPISGGKNSLHVYIDAALTALTRCWDTSMSPPNMTENFEPPDCTISGSKAL